MTEQPFDACWSRWDRANDHRKALVEVWNDYLAEHPYDFALRDEGDGTFVLQVWQEKPIPTGFAVLLGEWLYNLRASLDYLVWATAVYETGVLPPKGEGVLQYPIYDSPKAWESNLYRLKGLAEHQRAHLKTMQPFSSDPDSNFLGWINRLARIDRHRRLMGVTSYLAEVNPVTQAPADCKITLQWGQRVLVDGAADAVKLTVRPWREGTSVKMNPRIGIDPEVAEWSKSNFWRRVDWAERLVMMQVFVAGEIACYEYDCTRGGRKAHVPSETFRAECDARPRKSFVTHRSAWEWGAPVTGSPTTRARFEGKDFPRGSVPRSEWPQR